MPTMPSMQRLFSMFPTGRPGIALLLLRTALSVTLLEDVLGRLAYQNFPWILVPLWAVAIALCVGFLTPVTSLVCVAFEAATWRAAGGALEPVHLCAILDGVALALLGPGAYPLEARL